MSALGQVVLGWAVNACWQLPCVLLVFHLLIKIARSSPARIQHQIWLLGTAMSVLLPMGGLWGLYSEAGSSGIATASAQPPEKLQAFALTVWILAAAFSAARFVRTAIASRRARLRATPLASRFGVELRLSPPELASAGPLLIGIRRPVVLIPAFLDDRANAGLLEAAMAHELAHVKRRDMLAYVLSELALIPLAFHPAAWWLRRRLSESRELACDEQAVREMPSPVDYARALLEIGRRALHPAAPLHSLGVADGGLLERRIRALVETPHVGPSKHTPFRKVVLVLAAGVIAGLLTWSARSVYWWLADSSSLPMSIVERRIRGRYVKPPPPPGYPPRPRRTR